MVIEIEAAKIDLKIVNGVGYLFVNDNLYLTREIPRDKTSSLEFYITRPQLVLQKVDCSDVGSSL